MNAPTWKGRSKCDATLSEPNRAGRAKGVIRLNDAHAINAEIGFDLDEIDRDSLPTQRNGGRKSANAAADHQNLRHSGHQWSPLDGSMPVMWLKSQAGGFIRKDGRL